MSDVEILGAMLALLGPGTLALLFGLRMLRNLDLYHPPSLVAPLAIVLTYLPATWVASVVTRDHAIAREAGVEGILFSYALAMPVLMIAAAVCFAGPILLATHVPALARMLRAQRPSARRNAAAGLCTALLIGLWVTVAGPFHERLEMFHAVRSQQASRDELVRYAAIAVANFDGQLGNIVARSPDADARVFSVLVGRCLTRSSHGECRDWLTRISHHGRAMPADMRARIRNAIGLRAVRG